MDNATGHSTRTSDEGGMTGISMRTRSAIVALCALAVAAFLWQCAGTTALTRSNDGPPGAGVSFAHLPPQTGTAVKPAVERGMVRGGIANFAAWLKVRGGFI